MEMAIGSHKQNFRSERVNVNQGMTQMKIAEKSLAKFENFHCNFNLGDAILFIFNSPYRTGYNTSGVPRTTMVTRFTETDGKYSSSWIPAP